MLAHALACAEAYQQSLCRSNATENLGGRETRCDHQTPGAMGFCNFAGYDACAIGPISGVPRTLLLADFSASGTPSLLFGLASCQLAGFGSAVTHSRQAKE